MIIKIIYIVSVLFSLLAFISFFKDVIKFIKKEKVYVPNNGNKLKFYLAIFVFIFIALIPILNIIISSIFAFSQDFFDRTIESIKWEKINDDNEK